MEEGFVLHPSIPDFGASPDGLVGDDGLVEIKCPATATHIETLLTETVPGKYITQMQAQMACTGRAWCDFVVRPRMPGDMQLLVKRVPRPGVHVGDGGRGSGLPCRTRPETGRADRGATRWPHDPLPRPKGGIRPDAPAQRLCAGWTSEAMMVDFAAAALGEGKPGASAKGLGPALQDHGAV